MLPHRADPFRSVAGSLLRVKRKHASGCLYLGSGGSALDRRCGADGGRCRSSIANLRARTLGAFSERQSFAAIASSARVRAQIGKRPRLGFADSAAL